VVEAAENGSGFIGLDPFIYLWQGIRMTYYVSIPITGSAAFEVEAKDRKSAIQAAWAKVDAGEEGEVTWEYTEIVTEGNCCHAVQNEIEVTKGGL